MGEVLLGKQKNLRIRINSLDDRRKLPTTGVCTASAALSPQPLGACCETVRAGASCNCRSGSGPLQTARPAPNPAAAAPARRGDLSPPAAVSAWMPENCRGRKPMSN